MKKFIICLLTFLILTSCANNTKLEEGKYVTVMRMGDQKYQVSVVVKEEPRFIRFGSTGYYYPIQLDENQHYLIEGMDTDFSSMDKDILTVTFDGKTSTLSLEKKEMDESDFKEGAQGYSELLQAYNEYTHENQDYLYQYPLGVLEENESWIEKHKLNEVLGSKKDVELMEAALNWVCAQYNHTPSISYPKLDLLNLAEAMDETKVGNCNYLSIVLTHLLLRFNIPAVPIYCLPAQQNAMDSHVVVQAYSAQLDQWILLNPTYNLMLKDDEDHWIGVEDLRAILINDENLVPNQEAGYNEGPFDLAYYRHYMSKNCFRFERAIVANDPMQGMTALNPKNYGVAKTDWDAFWRKPE